MADLHELARLRISPGGSGEPLPAYVFKLLRRGDVLHIHTTEMIGRTRRRWRVRVPLSEVVEWFEVLRSARLPAFAVSPLVCDGHYLELTIHGQFAALTLGWWTIAPAGADALADFAEWMRGWGLPKAGETQPA